MRTGYRNTLEEISRIQRGPPPVVPMTFASDSLVTRAWRNDEIHDEVAPMEHHVIAPTICGSGWSEVRFGAKSIRSPSITGGITIAPRGFGGRFDCDGTPVASNVFLSRSRLQHSADALGSPTVVELVPRLNFHDPKLFTILSLVAAEADELSPHSRLYLEMLIDLLCVQLLRSHAAFELRPPDHSRGLPLGQVRIVTDYMTAHLDEAISLEQLAKLAGLSRFHFCTAFRKSTGFTPHEWLIRLRIERAKELLTGSRLPITEIALTVGYQTPSSFAHAFRMATGMTPSEFRFSRD